MVMEFSPNNYYFLRKNQQRTKNKRFIHQKKGMKRAIILCLVWLSIGCVEKEDLLPTGTQLLRNSNLSNSMDNVRPWVSTVVSTFNLGVSDEVYFSGNRSIFLEGTDSLATGSVAWAQHYSGPLPSNRRLRFRAMLKAENIELHSSQSNVWVTIRAWSTEQQGGSLSRMVSSQRSLFISDTFDWSNFELTLPSTPRDADRVSVFLVMGPRTTGRVYFDNITLTVE